jgi:hypothetical protein
MSDLRAIAAIGLLLVAIGAAVFAYSRSDQGDSASAQVVTIKSAVRIFFNHPEFGASPASDLYSAFRQDACERCVIGTHADIDSDYQIHMGDVGVRLL